jgi:hypothetical protein
VGDSVTGSLSHYFAAGTLEVLQISQFIEETGSNPIEDYVDLPDDDSSPVVMDSGDAESPDYGDNLLRLLRLTP